VIHAVSLLRFFFFDLILHRGPSGTGEKNGIGFSPGLKP
jgi:hypothetical protein